MKKLASLSSVVGALAIATTGCMTQNEYYDQYDPDAVELISDDDMMQYQGNLALTEGHMRGDVGTVRGIDGPSSLLTGYGDGEYASIEVHAEGREGAAMNLLEIYGGLDALEPGFSRTFAASDEMRYDTLGVQLLNCSGESRYAWDYDEPADEVHLEVSETDIPETLRVDYTATTHELDPFTGMPTGRVSLVEGQFDVER